MLRNVGIVSFLIGVVVMGASAGLYMITMRDCEEEREKQEVLIFFSSEVIEHSKSLLQILQTKPYKTQADLQQGREFSQSIIQNEIDIKSSNYELGNLVRRERQAKRYLFLGIGIGLYLCLLQTPFLMIAGRQN